MSARLVQVSDDLAAWPTRAMSRPAPTNRTGARCG